MAHLWEVQLGTLCIAQWHMYKSMVDCRSNIHYSLYLFVHLVSMSCINYGALRLTAMMSVVLHWTNSTLNHFHMTYLWKLQLGTLWIGQWHKLTDLFGWLLKKFRHDSSHENCDFGLYLLTSHICIRAYLADCRNNIHYSMYLFVQLVSTGCMNYRTLRLT